MKNSVGYKALCVLATIFTLLGVNIFNISLRIFVLIVFVCIIVITIEITRLYFLKKESKRRKKINKTKVKRLIKTINDTNNVNDKCDYISRLFEHFLSEEISEKNNIYKNSSRNIKIATFVIFFIIMTTCVSNYKNIITFAHSIVITIKRTSQEDVQQEYIMQEDTSQEDVQQEYIMQEDTSQEDTILKNEKDWVKFRLKYPNGYPDIEQEYKELSDSLFYEDTDNLNEKIKSKITIWLNSCKVNTSLDNAVTLSGESTKYYSDIEKRFTNKEVGLLSSDLLDEVINGRKELFKSHPNGKLAWLLANHMQTYALNYLNQTNNEISILYFYLQSIRYTQESLEFDMDNESKYKQIKYIQSRYKDIAECEIVNSDIRLMAYEVYISIQEVLNELNISQP